MREIRPSGLEGGVRLIPHPYPYRSLRLLHDPGGTVKMRRRREARRGVSKLSTASIRRVSGACPASLPRLSPASTVGLAYATEALRASRARGILGWATHWPQAASVLLRVVWGADLVTAPQGLKRALVGRITYWCCRSYKMNPLRPVYPGHSAPRRRGPGEATVEPRRISHVGRVTV